MQQVKGSTIMKYCVLTKVAFLVYKSKQVYDDAVEDPM